MRPRNDSPPFVDNLAVAKPSRGGGRWRFRTATALASGLLVVLATPAMAQQTSGGAGGGPTGGAGGASSATGTGGNGGDHSATGGGGGGGAGENGGAGGTGENGGGVFAGGGGGAAPGGNGSSGGSGPYSAGGGGGAHGYVDTILPTLTDRTGGLGGDGGQGGDYGGGGGAGGYGAVITGGGSLGTLTVSVIGGRGGIGGVGFLGPFGSGFGTGGQGGHGLVLTAASTLTIGAAVSGGQGGPLSFSIVGQGGSGIVGGDLDLTVGAAVSGGLSGDGTTRGYSLFFDGGANNLTLGAGWSLAGGIFINGGSLTLSPSGDLTLVNDISGSGSFAHTGFGTLVLTGTNTYSGGTTIGTSTLQIGAGGTIGTLGTGAIVNDGNLVFNRSDDITVADNISGGGSITKIGGGTLSLTGNNSYTGTTSILSGTLAVQAGAIDSSQLVEIGNGATLRALTGFGIGGPTSTVSILSGGGTIDTGLANHVVTISGDIDYGGQLTVTGGGLLFINDVNGTGSGGINVLSGTLALGGDFAAGEGAILLANGTTLENAAFACGCNSLILANNIEVENGGTATINGFGRYTGLYGQLSGGNFRFINGSQGSEGPGTLAVFELTGANSYGSTFIGANTGVVLTGTGTLGAGDVTFDSAPSNPSIQYVPGLVFANDQDYGFEGAIIGNGFVIVDTFDPATAVSLYGSNTSGNNFTGTITVFNGRLNIEGNVGDIDNLSASLIVDGCACSDATLGGSGTFFGNIDFLTGTLAAGSSPGTLNIAGNLTLGAGTILNFELGQPGVVGNGVNDFVTVGGNLTLDGTLNVIDFGPSYGPGYYALFRYGGTLTDNTLNIGTIAGGLSTSLLFNIPGQVNLLLGPQVIQYWDGADATGVSAGSGAANGDGGAGTWSATNTNWTAASGFGVNDQWRSTIGIFAGAAGGTVTVEGAQSFQELRFQTDGYLLRPAGFFDRLNTTGGFSIVQVDPGLTADIGVQIGGAAGLTKTGTGTLILSASNSYAGATNITAGTLRMGDAFVLPGATAVTVSAGATLNLNSFQQTIGSLAGAGSVLGTGGFDTGGDNSSTTFSGTIDFGGFVSKSGTGTWTLTGASTFANLFLFDGTLNVGATGVLNGDVSVFGCCGMPTFINNGTINGSFSTDAGAIVDNSGTINGTVSNRSMTFTNNGTITSSNFYTLFNIFGGVLTNNGLIEGRVQNAEFGFGGTLNNAGTINGFVENDASGIINSTGTINGSLNNYGTVFLAGQLNGDITNRSGATVTLTGTTTGITSYNGQPGAVALDLANFDTAIDSISGEGEIRLGSARLTIGANDALSFFSGVISGSGGLTKIGTSVAFLSGLNTYSGLTAVNAGILEVSIGGAIAGDVNNSATFRNYGFVGGFVDNAGDLTNDGTLNNGARNQGGGTVFNTTGIINPLISGLALTNGAGSIVNARGQINGIIENTGTFNVTGVLTGITRMNGFPGSSFNLQGNNLALGGLDGSGDVNLGGATLTVGVGNLGSTFGGAINGLGGLTKVGNDVFTLSGQATFSGTTLVSGGTLQVVGTGTIAGPVVNNATLENFATINGNVSNNATYIQTGRLNASLINTGTALLRGQLNGSVDNQAGSITLTGFLTGITTFNNGPAALFDLNGFSTTIGSLSGGGEVRLRNVGLTVGGDNSSTSFAGMITGNGAFGLTKVGTGTLTLSGANTYDGLTTVSAGTLTLSSTGRLAGNVLNNAIFNNAGRVELAVTNNGTANNSGTIASFVINSGTFTNTGTIETDVVNNAGATFFASGAINRYVDNRGTFNGQGVTGIQDFGQSATGIFNLTTASMAVGGLGGAGVINLAAHALTVGGSNFSGDFSGVINGLGGLTKVGTGVLTLSGVNTYTGLTRVDNGFLVIASTGRIVGRVENNFVLQNEGTITGQIVNSAGSSASNLGGTMSGGLVNFGSFFSNGIVSGGVVNTGNAEFQGQLNGAVDNRTGGVIRISAATTGIGRVDQSAGALFNLQGFNTSFGALAGAGEVRLGGAVLTVGGDNSSTTFAGIVTGSGSSGLTKVGTGTLTLSGSNTYAGLTTVSAGTLTLASTGRISGNVFNNAAFNNDGRVDLVVTNNGTGTNSGTIAGGLNNGGAFTSTGRIDSAVQNLAGGTLGARGQLNGFVNNGGTFNVTGALTGIGIFSQAATGQLNLGGFNLALGSLNGLGGVALGAGLLTVGSNNLTTGFGGVITGSGGLTKVGTGTLALNAANTYTGLTTVSAGRLDISVGGSLAGALLNNSLVENRGAIGGLVTNNNIMFSYGTMGGGLTNNAGAQFNNDTLAIITGAVLNNGRLDNFGTINGVVTNSGNLLSARAINGGLVNSGTALLGGVLSGPLTNNAGTVTLGGTTTGITVFTQLAGATFNLAGFSTAIGSLAGAGAVQLGGAILTAGGDNSSTAFAGIISGTGASGLTKVGTGTLTLSGVNTYAGITTVNAGTLSVASTGGIALAVNFATLLNAGSIGAVDNRAGGTFTNGGTVANGVINAGTMTSTGIINTGFQNSGTAQLRGQLNGFVNANAGTITLTGSLTGIGAFTQGGGATLNLNGFSLTLGSLSGAGSITFGGATPAGGLEPATASAVELAAAVAAVTRAGLVPDDQAGGNGATQSMPGSAEVATMSAATPAVASAATPNWLVADTATPGAAGLSASGGGRAAGFGLVATESAQAAPGAGLVAIESPMARVGATTLGGNGDIVTITDGTTAAPAGSDTNGALVVNLTGGGDLVRIADAATPAAPVLLAVGGSTLTPLALPPATGPVLTVGADNSSTLFAGVISGNGRLAKVGTGTLILTGNNTYTDGTLISGGVLQLGNGGTSGSILGRIENNAILIVNRSDALTLSGIIDGTGLFLQAGTGTTTLTGANAYTGGTLITAGRLRGDTVSLQGQFQINAGTLEFNQATTATFAGQLFGAGAVEKTGAGLLTFTGDSSNLTGGTTILGGELRVNSLLSRSRVTVGNGGTLSGTGITGGLTAQSGGTVAPGAGTFGTLGVNGTIQFLAGSTFAAQVQPSGSDLLLGNNTAMLAGTIAVANAGGVYRFNSIYVLLQADGGRTGTFTTETGLNTFGQAYLPRIVYTPTQVQLLMAPNQLLNIAGPDGTPNQRSTLTRIDAAAAAGYDPQPLIALYFLTPRDAFLNGADQLSGEIYATSVRAALDEERLVREATLGRLRLTQDMGFASGFGMWGHAVGSWGSGDTDGNAARYERDQQGFVVGIDGGGTFDGGSWRLGLLGHHLSTDVRVDARGSNAELERSGAGIYGGLDFGALRIRAGGTYASLDLDGTRTAAFTGFAETLRGETDGTALQGFAEISYRFQVGAATHVEPYVQAALAHVEFDAFSETGGASRLRIAAEEDDLTTLAFGLRAGTVMPLGGDTRLRVDGAVGARHLSGDRMIFSLISLDTSPNQAFDIRSAAADRFALTGNADATFEFGRSVSLTIGYSGVVSGNARDHAARATLGIRF